MSGRGSRFLALSALMCAVVFCATYFIKIPVGVMGGYINAGDAVICAAALLLGRGAVLPAAVGSALADLLGGAAVYAAPTFVIKGAMGYAAAIIQGRKLAENGGKPSFARYLLSAGVAGLIMTAGYFLVEALFFGLKYAVAGMPFNLVQWGGNVLISAALYRPLKGIPNV
ncbi:MAG: ECF transporter S component [Clostridiales bacterium]|jgi:uncharacterized membrane protein|nr:ECF transporter S component [Clostridiales bacterium]